MEFRKILIVDDDADDLAIISDAINKIHQENITHCFDNASDAIEMLHQYGNASNLPCLIVLDLNMPKMNGRQALQHLKGDPLFSAIPIVIYSTSINPVEKEACLSLGAQAYITKPVSYNECLDTAKRLIQYCSITVGA